MRASYKLCHQVHQCYRSLTSMTSIYSKGCVHVPVIHGLKTHLSRSTRWMLSRCSSSIKKESRKLSSPAAKRQAIGTVHHEYKLFDHYWWMKTSLFTQDLRNYIDQEMRLTETFIQETQPFQTQIRKRLEEMEMETVTTDMPTVIDGTTYFRRSYRDSWCYYRRRNGKGNGNSHMELILDTATLTEMYGHPVGISAVKISPDQELLAFVVETTAMDTYDAHVVQIGNDGAVFIDLLKDVFSVEFGHQGVMYYTKLQGLRAAEVWRHHVGQDASQDQMILEEPGTKYFVDLSHTKDRQYVTVNINSLTTSEVHLLDSCSACVSPPVLVFPRWDGVRYAVEHSQGELYVLTNADTDGEYKVVALQMPVDDNTSLASIGHRSVFTPEKNCHIQDMDVFSDHCVLCVMEGTVPRIIIIPVDSRRQTKVVKVPEDFCKITPGPNATCTANYFQFSLSSPMIPTTNFHLDLGNESNLKVVHRNFGDEDTDKKSGAQVADRKKSVCTRLAAKSKDGTLVPITVFHRDDVRLNGGNPMLVCGYGAYGVALDMSYNHHTALLLELGWMVAYCHVRGGSDLGLQWHHSGRAINKIKSLEDFEACITTLHKAGYSRPALTAAHGVSVGGFLVAALCNRAPNLVRAAILEVPYVDVLSTMLNRDLPLTQQETEEWGDPLNDPAAFHYIKSYCPYQNITDQEYPAMLVTASLADTRVPFWVPLKYVAKLRHMMSSSPRSHNSLYLWMLEDSNHFGQWGELDGSEQAAVQTAFLYRALGLPED